MRFIGCPKCGWCIALALPGSPMVNRCLNWMGPTSLRLCDAVLFDGADDALEAAYRLWGYAALEQSFKRLT